MDTSVSSTATRRIALSREGGYFRLAFAYDREIVSLVKQLPSAVFDAETKTWTSVVCSQSRDELVRLHRLGYIDVDPDTLVDTAELEPLAPATLRSGTERRPYLVQMATRNDSLYAKLTSVNGSRWERETASISYPPTATVALSELVSKGVISDPGGILDTDGVSVAFDPRVGSFTVLGDRRANEVFQKKFPGTDVVEAWSGKGLTVSFADSFSEEMYRGELSRLGAGIQPSGMAIDLYPYQQVDVAMAVERSGLLVAHSMGVGKTAIAIAAGHELLENRQEVPKVIVICPAAIRTQWRNEIIRFTGAAEEDVVVIDGSTKAKRMESWDRAVDAKWVIVHYQAVILPDDKKRVEKLAGGCLLIADECHRIKNHQAKSTKVIQGLGRKAARRIGLSGTPVENNPGEWFNILSGFLNPGVFGSPTDFLGRYSYPSRFGGYDGARNLAELRKRSDALYTRRTLSQVAEHLPKQRINTITLEPKSDYASALRRAHKEARDEIAEQRIASAPALAAQEGIDAVEAGAEMTAVGLLKLMCLSPRLISDSDAPSAQALTEAGLVPDDDGPKMDELRQMALEMHAAGERLVVFTASKRMAYLVADRLEQDGVPAVMFTGDSSTDERDAAVTAFTTASSEENPGPTVFVATDAGAEGLNLGKCCSTLVNLDIPWTPGRLAQRNARVRRVDSEQESFLVVNLVLHGTIEQGILRMVEHKADLADAVLGEKQGRRSTTGRAGRNVFDQALSEWSKDNS